MTTIAHAEDGTQRPPDLSEREAFLRERLTGIGGSDAAAILGENPYKTPYQLYLEKRGEAELDDLSDNAAVEFGNRLEDVVADAYADRAGVKVHRVHRTLRHPQHPFIMAHLDRRVVGDKKGLECKTAGFWAARSDEWGPSGSDIVPTQYLLQVQHYMLVTGYVEFDLAVLVAGNDFRIYNIRRNEDLLTIMMQAEIEFWERIRNGEPPAARSVEDARLRYPVSSDVFVEATPEIVLAETELRGVEATFKDLEARKDALQGRIMDFMGSADTLTRAGQKLRTWKSQETARIVPDMVRNVAPQIAAECTVTSSSRVFRACKIGGAK